MMREPDVDCQRNGISSALCFFFRLSVAIVLHTEQASSSCRRPFLSQVHVARRCRHNIAAKFKLMMENVLQRVFDKKLTRNALSEAEVLANNSNSTDALVTWRTIKEAAKRKNMLMIRRRKGRLFLLMSRFPIVTSSTAIQ